MKKSVHCTLALLPGYQGGSKEIKISLREPENKIMFHVLSIHPDLYFSNNKDTDEQLEFGCYKIAVNW